VSVVLAARRKEPLRDAAVPKLRRRGGGIIINVGSVNSRVSAPYASAYVASKVAVRGFSECLRDELHGEAIDVCTVMPASIDTAAVPARSQLRGTSDQADRPARRPGNRLVKEVSHGQMFDGLPVDPPRVG
jgi:short-subunit dehydrogenase